PNGTRTYVDLNKSTSCDLITFLQHSSAIECWMSYADSGGVEQYNCCLISNPRLNSLLQTLMEEVLENREHARAVGESLLSAFLFVLHREVEAGQIQFIRPHSAP